MVNKIPVGASKNYSLEQLNLFVRQQEADLGPLVGLSNGGTQSVLTFDTDLATPDKPAVITPDKNGAPDVPSGSSAICSGEVFIAGTITAATASRPT